MTERTATGPGSITADGCAVDLYRRLTASGEPQIIHAAIARGSTILELGAGTGRVTHGLVQLGHRVTAVDSSSDMLGAIVGAETVLAKIEDLDLRRRFDAVVLGSNLINSPDANERGAFLASCRRHVTDEGLVLIECYSARDIRRMNVGPLGHRDGIRCSLQEFCMIADRFSATMMYETADATWTQRFSAIILERSDLEAELSRSGLRFVEWLDEPRRWFSAAPIVGHEDRCSPPHDPA